MDKQAGRDQDSDECEGVSSQASREGEVGCELDGRSDLRSCEISVSVGLGTSPAQERVSLARWKAHN